jgi:hypothetical protein
VVSKVFKDISRRKFYEANKQRFLKWNTRILAKKKPKVAGFGGSCLFLATQKTEIGKIMI